MRLKVDLGDYTLDNPIIPASGTFGFGYEFAKMYDINILGSISIKGTTLAERFGNEGTRIAETPQGMINAIGLQNPGVQKVISEELPKLREVYQKKVFANVGGHDVESYKEIVRLIQEDDMVEVIELNVSCPNVKHGGINCGTDMEILKEIVREVRKICKKKLYVKLTPNVTDIVSLAKVCEEAGADGLVLINTLTGMRVDIQKRKPVIGNVKGGLSGPAIFPVALRNIYDVYKAVKIPIVGVGGVSSARDVIEMMMCGARAVQIGSQNLIDPYACEKIINDLEPLLDELGIENIIDIVGVAHG